MIEVCTFLGSLASIRRGNGITEMWIPDAHLRWPRYPNMKWDRELSDHECSSMIYNPWQIFAKPEPDGRVMVRSDPA